MSDIGVRFVIEKVGDREALRALESLDKIGRQIVENVANATGKAMGDIANAYVTGGKAMQQSLAAVSDGWRQQQQEIAATARAADALDGRQAHSIATASRGLEMIGRTGQLTGRSLDAVVGQISAMAFSFGPTGQIVAAIGITTAAVVELFMRTSKEAKKLADETAHEFARIAHMDVAQQGDEAARLYSGDKFAERKMDRLSIPQMKARMAQLQASLPDAATTAALESQMGSLMALPSSSPFHKTGEAMKELDELDKEIDKRENIRVKIMGMNGSMADAGKRAAATDHWSFLEDDAKNAGRAGKKAELAAIAAEKALHRLNIANAKVDAATAVDATKRKQAREAEQAKGIEGSLVGWQSKTKLNFDLWNAPIEAAFKKEQTRIKSMADRLGADLGAALGSSLEAGFARAFSGEGIGRSIAAFGDTMLSGLGGIFVRQGEALINFSAITEGLGFALANPLEAPFVAAAEGAALIALGTALSAAVSGHGGSARGGMSGGYGGSSGLANIIDRGTITPGSYSTGKAADIQPRPSVNATFNVIGPNDPNAVRGIDEILRRINQRGSLAGGFG